MNHSVPSFYIRPNHPIKVTVIGIGGTGSQLLTRLAQMNVALLRLGHKGIVVRAFDPDSVTEFNVGRQSFYPTDIGLNKAEVLISRINRSFGFLWTAIPTAYDCGQADIFCSCVDTVASRKQIKKLILKDGGNRQSYWMDFGNSNHTGQIVLGTIGTIPQPKGVKDSVAELKDIFEMFPEISKFEDKTAPSCSMAEALSRQDLCINGMMAMWGQKILWTLFRDFRIENQGVFINLNTLTTSPIPIRA